MSHAVTAARLHLVTWRSAVIWPWAVLGSSLVINWVIQALLDPASREQGGTGGVASIYFVAAWLAYQAVSQVFPFALGMGVTRRAFAGRAQAPCWCSRRCSSPPALTVLRYLESATGGFGVELHFFRVPGLRQDDAGPAAAGVRGALPAAGHAADGDGGRAAPLAAGRDDLAVRRGRSGDRCAWSRWSPGWAPGTPCWTGTRTRRRW